MKLLHVAMGSPEIDRSFRELGHSVERIDWRQWKNREALNMQVMSVCTRFSPDVVFMQLQTPGVIHPHTVRFMRERGAVVMNWTGDVRDPLPDHYPQLGPHVNVTLFTNLTDVSIMRGMGYDADYLQIGYDETIYRPPERPVKREGVVFIGNNYGDRFPESRSRAALVDALRSAFGHRFKVYGAKWGGDSRPCIPTEEVSIYQRALVAVNWDHFVRPRFASDRILRAQACGACTVSRGYDGIEVEHPRVYWADSVDGVVELVEEMLEAQDATQAFGYMQAQHVRDHHTWHNRAERIIELAKQYT